jgi:hypothetical protein
VSSTAEHPLEEVAGDFGLDIDAVRWAQSWLRVTNAICSDGVRRS